MDEKIIMLKKAREYAQNVITVIDTIIGDIVADDNVVTADEKVVITDSDSEK